MPCSKCGKSNHLSLKKVFVAIMAAGAVYSLHDNKGLLYPKAGRQPQTEKFSTPEGRSAHFGHWAAY